MNRDPKQTVTLNLAINVDVTQLVALLKNYTPELLTAEGSRPRPGGAKPKHLRLRVGSLYRFHRHELIEWFQNSPRTA